jgi:hypothetical protein
MKNLLIALSIISIIGVGCNSNSNERRVDEEMVSLSKSEERLFDMVAQPMSEVPPPPSQISDISFIQVQDNPVKEQMLIRTAYIVMEVENYEVSRLKLDTLVKSCKSWISAEDMQNYDYRISNNLSIRVPAANLSKLISSILAIGKKIDNQRIESTDVTEEYIDTESRLNNQRAVEKKFTALLKQTKTIEEILQIESKLADIRGQIESLEGRIRYLNNRVSFSTINLNIYQKIDFKYAPEPMESFWERFKKSIHNGWKGLVAFILFIIRLWPLWVIAVGSWFVLRRYFRRKKVILPVVEKKKDKLKIKNKDNKHSKNLTTQQSE